MSVHPVKGCVGREARRADLNELGLMEIYFHLFFVVLIIPLLLILLLTRLTSSEMCHLASLAASSWQDYHLFGPTGPPMHCFRCSLRNRGGLVESTPRLTPVPYSARQCYMFRLPPLIVACCNHRCMCLLSVIVNSVRACSFCKKCSSCYGLKLTR